jgi:hypothetical protein
MLKITSPAHCFDRQRRLREIGEHEQLTPSMRPARGLGDRARLPRRVVEIVEPGIGIRLQDPRVAGEMTAGALAAAIARIVEDRNWRRPSAERAVLAQVDP